MIKCSYKPIFSNKNRIMFVFAHPDDAEIYAGGTIGRLVADSKEVSIVKMTLGNKGSRQEKVTEQELSDQRLAEDKAAMETFGIKDENNIYLNFKDGEITNDLGAIEKLVKQVRLFKPDLVITHNPEQVIIRFAEGVNWVNHRDHRNTGKSVIDACYPYSRDILFFPHHLADKNLSSHKVTEFLLVDYYDHVDTVFIDVTETMNVRNNALAKHSSQYSLQNAQDSTEFFTKLDDSGRNYEQFRYVVAD